MHVMLQGVLLRCTLVFVCCSSLVCALVTPPLAGAAARLVAETVTDNSTSSRYIQRPKCGDDASPLSTAEEGNPFSQLWNNTIAICAIARKEHIEDIREWLQYHRYIGIDHVFLHDNNEDGAAQAVQLQDFIDDGFLTLSQVDGEKKQMQVYEHCLGIVAGRYSWMAAFDIDEFIVVTDPAAKNAVSSVKAVLQEFRFRPGIWMQWRVFGAAGHKKRPAGGGPLKNYDKCIHHQGFNNMYGKSIVNMFWVKKTSNAHAFMYRAGGYAVSDAGEPMPAVYNEESSMLRNARARLMYGHEDRNSKLVVHHYATRSHEDFLVKQKRGGGDHSREVAYRGDEWFEEIQLYVAPHVCLLLLVFVTLWGLSTVHNCQWPTDVP